MSNAYPPATGTKFLVLMRQAVAKYGKPSRWNYQTKVEVRQWVCEQLKAVQDLPMEKTK